MEKDYSKREIDEKFTDIKLSLDRIEKQTITTNGKVASLVLWRAYIVGALTVIGFFLASVLIPIVGSFIQAGNHF